MIFQPGRRNPRVFAGVNVEGLDQRLRIRLDMHDRHALADAELRGISIVMPIVCSSFPL